MMQMLRLREKNEINSSSNFFEENFEQQESNIEKPIRKIYYPTNEHFSFQPIFLIGGKELLIVAYSCIYRYEKNQIQLEFRLQNRIWRRIYETSNLEEHTELNTVLKDMNDTTDLFSFEEQIQIITTRFDQYFRELNQQKETFFSEEDQLDNFNQTKSKNPSSKPSTIIELDEEQTDFVNLLELTDTNNKFNLLPSPTPSNRTRHDSSCSSTNSVKYAQFVPPSMTSVRRRRVIQSIHLVVQRKKKILDQFKEKSIEATIYRLGLEFLRLYDGKFNYPLGYTFVMSFEKRTWFLTINQIKCLEFQLGQTEPRSILVLQYKNKFTRVQV